MRVAGNMDGRERTECNAYTGTFMEAASADARECRDHVTYCFTVNLQQ